MPQTSLWNTNGFFADTLCKLGSLILSLSLSHVWHFKALWGAGGFCTTWRIAPKQLKMSELEGCLVITCSQLLFFQKRKLWPSSQEIELTWEGGMHTAPSPAIHSLTQQCHMQAWCGRCESGLSSTGVLLCPQGAHSPLEDMWGMEYSQPYH